MLKIHENMNILNDFNSHLGHDDHYFQAENIMLHYFFDSAYVYNLDNALKVGKTCRCYMILSELGRYEGKKIEVELWKWCSEQGISMLELFALLTSEKLPESFNEKFTIVTRDKKGINTFSPFVTVKPIKPPAQNKWTIQHVWKAILSGQVIRGEIREKLTDDYAHDAAVNFRKGESINLQEFAKELIQSPSGWSANGGSNVTDGIFQIQIRCHHFDYRTLYFDTRVGQKNHEPSTESQLQQKPQNVISLQDKIEQKKYAQELQQAKAKFLKDIITNVSQESLLRLITSDKEQFKAEFMRLLMEASVNQAIKEFEKEN